MQFELNFINLMVHLVRSSINSLNFFDEEFSIFLDVIMISMRIKCLLGCLNSNNETCYLH